MAEASTSALEDVLQQLQGEDETDFWERKPKTLLDRFKRPSVSFEDLEEYIKSGEDFNAVEDIQADKEQLGYGAIHYIITAKHKNKVELLRLLAIVTNANLDLTSTKYGHTALHLAIEIGDMECIKTLVALGANVNKTDLLGNTPLDTSRMKANKLLEDDVRMSRLGGPTVFIEGTEARMRGFSQTIELSSSTEEGESQVNIVNQPPLQPKPQPLEDEITTQLLSVGAVTGSKLQQKENSDSLPPSMKKRKTSAHEFTDSVKISCTYYKQLEDEIHTKLFNGDCEPTAEESQVLVRQLQQQARYQRRFGSRILCLDGGGIRGLIQLAVLQELENRTGKSVTELFDWIVGTSTGGIIALAMVYGPPGSGSMSVKKLRNMYWRNKNEIFTKSSDGLMGLLAKGNSEKLEKLLKRWLGENVRLDGTTVPKVLIPAVYKKESNLDLHFFNNCFDQHPSEVDAETSAKLNSQFVWKVARCTSAAPFYFTEFDDYIDGGVLANNPSEEALTAIQDYYRQKGEKLPISLLVSIGSGVNPSKSVGTIDVHTKLLNPKAWLNFFDVMGDAVLNKTAHSNCRSRCREQGIEYFRFSPPLSQTIDSDQKDSVKLTQMLWETRQYLHSVTEEVDKLVSLLRDSELVTS